MKKTNRLSSLIHATAALAAFSALIATAEAKTHSRSGSATITNDRGRTAQVDRQVERGRGFRNQSTDWTTARGTGSATRHQTWDRTSGTGTRDWSQTGAGGRTRSGTATAQRNDDGSLSVDNSRTGKGGQTVSASRHISQTDNGRAVEGTYTNRQGADGSFSKSVQREDHSITKTETLTRPNGEEKSRTQTWTTETTEPGT